MNPARLVLGDFEVLVLRDGFLTVDAAEMFGSADRGRRGGPIPKSTNDRRAISLNCFLIRTGKRLVLVDTGAGETLDGPRAESYGFFRDPGLIESLHGLGHRPENIDLVINTHLHFDHCGGNTMRGVDGSISPAFPRAEYVIQKGEWATGLNPSPSEGESYARETFLPLETSGRLRLVEGDACLCPGVIVMLSPGHTPGHQSVKLESRGRVLVILGDLVPTSAHVSLSAVSGFDLDPGETAVNKQKIFEQGLKTSWIYGFVHDARHPFGRVERPAARYVFRPAGN